MIYAVGDIHAQLDQLVSAHRLIGLDRERHGGAGAPVVHLGDLVDRGPNARGVVQFLLDGIARGEEWVVLKGNHDRLFADFLAGGDGSDSRLRPGLSWLHQVMGGKATLASYGVERKLLESAASFRRRARVAVPGAHAEFVAGLPLWYRAEGMIFVHAGIRPGFPMDAQDEDDLLWIRDEFLWHSGRHEALIVHGHTPVDEPTHYGNRVNIDTGAGWGSALVPVVFEDGACFALTEAGREKVRPPGEYYQ